MRTMVVCLLAVITLAGCTGHKTTVTTNNGTETVTTSGDNQTVTVQGKEGTATIGKGAVDTAKIGLPVYPGANSADNAGYAATTKEGTGQVAMLTTADSFDKVYAWYKQQMPAGSEQMHMTSSGGSVAAFQIGKDTDATKKVVTITSSQDKTSIMLSSQTKP